jgi:hypothetical protein
MCVLVYNWGNVLFYSTGSWTLEIATRKRKKSASNKDVSYIDPHGKKYRSWAEVKRVAWYLQSSSEEEEEDGDDTP